MDRLNELKRWLDKDLLERGLPARQLLFIPILHNPDVVILQLHGWSVNLYSDGTWIIEDTSGG